MAYDEGLAERIRQVLGERGDVTERRMFGGLAFLVRGNMTVGIVKDELMVRVGEPAYERLVGAPHARAMDFTGRPMRGFVFVAPLGLEADADLERWVGHGLEHGLSLPAKVPGERRPSGGALAAPPRGRKPARQPAKQAKPKKTT